MSGIASECVTMPGSVATLATWAPLPSSPSSRTIASEANTTPGTRMRPSRGRRQRNSSILWSFTRPPRCPPGPPGLPGQPPGLDVDQHLPLEAPRQTPELDAVVGHALELGSDEAAGVGLAQQPGV